MAQDSLWRVYQHAIANLFRRHPEAWVEEDVEEVGQDSGVPRQLDVRISLPFTIELGRGIAPTVDVKVIVDAKLYSEQLDVADVGRLVALKDDVRAQLLIAVTALGASPGAVELGRNKGVFVLTVTPDLVAMLQDTEIPEAATCLFCRIGIVGWNLAELLPEQLAEHQGLHLQGACDRCAGIHVRCNDCGMIQGVEELEVVKCPGACGSIYWVEANRREGTSTLRIKDPLDVALLITAHRRKTGRVSAREVDRLARRTKWQHWDMASPTISLTEDGLMEWRDDGSLYITGEGRSVAETLERAEESSYYDLKQVIGVAPLIAMFQRFGVRPIGRRD